MVDFELELSKLNNWNAEVISSSISQLKGIVDSWMLEHGVDQNLISEKIPSCTNSEYQVKVMNDSLYVNSDSPIDDDSDILLAELGELKQISSVSEYYDEFVRVVTRMQLPDDDYRTYLFMCGLNEEIRCYMNMFDPRNLDNAYSLAIFHEFSLYTQKNKSSSKIEKVETLEVKKIEEIYQESDACKVFVEMSKRPFEDDNGTKKHDDDDDYVNRSINITPIDVKEAEFNAVSQYICRLFEQDIGVYVDEMRKSRVEKYSQEVEVASKEVKQAEFNVVMEVATIETNVDHLELKPAKQTKDCAEKNNRDIHVANDKTEIIENAMDNLSFKVQDFWEVNEVTEEAFEWKSSRKSWSKELKVVNNFHDLYAIAGMKIEYDVEQKDEGQVKNQKRQLVYTFLHDLFVRIPPKPPDFKKVIVRNQRLHEEAVYVLNRFLYTSGPNLGSDTILGIVVWTWELLTGNFVFSRIYSMVWILSMNKLTDSFAYYCWSIIDISSLAGELSILTYCGLYKSTGMSSYMWWKQVAEDGSELCHLKSTATVESEFATVGSAKACQSNGEVDYLYLGNYVNRGQHGLETITLLLALKVDYPQNIHLIRGNHEAADLVALIGFRIECIERRGKRDGIWVWYRINRLFNRLPLAASKEKKIVWPDRVMEFCDNNDLQLIVRAQECVMDGSSFVHCIIFSGILKNLLVYLSFKVFIISCTNSLERSPLLKVCWSIGINKGQILLNWNHLWLFKFDGEVQLLVVEACCEFVPYSQFVMLGVKENESLNLNRKRNTTFEMLELRTSARRIVFTDHP